MEVIKDTIRNVMQSWEEKKRNSRQDDPQKWLKKALTKKELGHAQARYFKKGVLSISVDSSSWLYYFSLQKEKLLAKLRKNSTTIKDIRLSLGEMK